jgi:hypothetical protein
VTFVPKLDFISGLGYHPARRLGQGPRYLITDLGEFDFENGRLRLISYHPGVEIPQIQKKTNFEIIIPKFVSQTKSPSPEELHLLRDAIDPLGIRRLERLTGSSRRKLLTEIINQEKVQT